MKQPACIINPASGKPFARHNLINWDGLLYPHTYAFDLVCKREGYGFSQTIRY